MTPESARERFGFLLDALQFAALPVIEVHISNIHAREAFRHRSLISPIANGVIMGLGPAGYALAVTALAGILAEQTDT